jgi:DNA-binding LacI/PurR family transcriptional regulator
MNAIQSNPARRAMWWDGRVARSRVTSFDVARRAGVSQSTVSLVLSGKAPGRIAPATAQAVRAAAAELGYRPNPAARSLRTGLAGAVGLAVPDITHPFMGRVMRGAQRAAWEAGFAVALVDTANDPRWARDSVAALQAVSVDGLLLFSVDPPPKPWAEPIVLIQNHARGLTSVDYDIERAVTLTATHLLELGHRRIGRLAAGIDEDSFRRRAEPLAQTLATAGVELAAQSHAVFTLESARAATFELLDAGVTAILADDDVLASGALVAARERGVRVPADVSVVGLDDLDLARITNPPLTTVALDPERSGAVAFAALERELAGALPRRRREVLPVELVVRESTGPPP